MRIIIVLADFIAYNAHKQISMQWHIAWYMLFEKEIEKTIIIHRIIAEINQKKKVYKQTFGSTREYGALGKLKVVAWVKNKNGISQKDW